MVEGKDSTVLTQAVVNETVSGVTVSVYGPANVNVTTGGTITFGSSLVTGDVTFTLTSNSVTQDCIASIVVPAHTVPGVPTNVNAVADNRQTIISFSAPAYGGGSIINYTVTSSPDNITVSGIGSPITITRMTNGTAYTFTVTATNDLGTGAASSATEAVTPSQQVQDSTISMTTVSFDKKPSAQADIVLNMYWNGNSLNSISDGTTPLIMNTDYTVTVSAITIKKEYLAEKSIGAMTLAFTFNAGAAQTLIITIYQSSSSDGGDNSTPTNTTTTGTTTTNPTTATGVDIQINGKTENAGQR